MYAPPSLSGAVEFLRCGTLRYLLCATHWVHGRIDLMQKEFEDRIRDLRSKVRAERTILSDLEGRLKDSYMRQLIQHVSYTLDDVENFFLGSLGRESRTPAAQSKWIDHAEFVFYQIAVPQRKHVQDIVAKYGPDVMTIPSPRP